MKYQWNDVLAAYDRELPLLRALGDEYDAFIGELFNTAWARLPPTCHDLAEIDKAVDEGDVMSAAVKLRGDQARAKLELQLWPAVAYGGPPGVLRWVLSVPRTVDEGYPSMDEMLTVVRAAASEGLPDVERGAPNEREILGPDHLFPACVGGIPLGAADVTSRVANTLMCAIAVMDATATTILARVVTTPRAWLESILLAMLEDGAFRAEGAGWDEQTSWKIGTCVNVGPTDTQASDYCFFTACKDGRLAFHWWAPKPEAEQRRVAVMRTFSPTVAFPTGGYDGVVLLDALAVEGHLAKGEAVRVRTLIRDTWRGYRAACLGQQV